MAQSEINVNDLGFNSSVSSGNSFLVLTDEANNVVKLITKSNMINSIISTTANNKLTSDATGLYVSSANTPQAITSLATSGNISLSDNSINTIVPTGTVTFVLPTVTNTSIFHQILVQMKLTSAYTINNGTTYYFNGEQPTYTTGNYDVLFVYDSSIPGWVCGAVYKGAGS